MKIHWKIVMFVAIIAMLAGLAVSVWGIGHENIEAAWIGLITIGAVCVSWWFWVMFVIRTMIECTDKTNQGLSEIKTGIKEVRGMVQELDSNESR
jgi:quinol-cytochrome oxidoreductase complex cytochrome b subunit